MPTPYLSIHEGAEVDAAVTAITAHVLDLANPHAVTRAQLGLGAADSPSFAGLTLTTLGIGISAAAASAPIHIAQGGAVDADLVTSDQLVISAEGMSTGMNIVVASDASAVHRGVFKATRARGSLLEPEVPLTDDIVFSLLGAIYDGAGSAEGTAAIDFIVDGPVSDGVAPQRISFLTSATTAAARTERLAIKSNGNVEIGPAFLYDATAKLLTLSPTLSAATGVEKALALNPTINQSGTAGYTVLEVGSTESATGSGAKILAQFGGATGLNVHPSGKIGLGVVSDGVWGIDTLYSERTMLLGGDSGSGTSRTDLTPKQARIGIAHYDNSEEPVNLFFCSSVSTSLNVLNIGGGTAALNNVSRIVLQCSQDAITTGSDPVMTIQRDANGAKIAMGANLPNSNAILDLQSTTKAFMPPRMTTTQRDAIPSPTAGMVIWNTTTSQLEDYDGSAWAAV